MHPFFLIDLVNSTPKWKPNFGPTPCRKSKVLWLPFGFHPTLHRTLSKAVADLSKCVQRKQRYSMAFGVACPCVRQSWYNALRAQATIIKQLGRKYGWWSDDDLIPFFCVRSARPLFFCRKTSVDCTASVTDAVVDGLKSTSTSARAFHCRSTSCTSRWFCDHSDLVWRQQ